EFNHNGKSAPAQHPNIVQKDVNKLNLSCRPSQNIQARYGGFERPAIRQRQFEYGNYTNAGLQYSTNANTVFVQAASEKGFAGFAIDFLMGGVSAAVSNEAFDPKPR
ncbi:ADP,ATP carrier, mitochondrial, partial [Olea europaea subsp. europaea]